MADRSWDLPESKVTPESAFHRRRWMIGLGAAAGLAAVGTGAYWLARGTDKQVLDAGRDSGEPGPITFDLSSHKEFTSADRPWTKRESVARHVNFYEFSPVKFGTWRKAAALPTFPWEISIGGLVKTPKIYSIDELEKTFGTEQRVYRFRCVETWAMVVPWIGIPLKKIIAMVEPKSSAKYVVFRTADIKALTKIEPPDGFTWPYHEGLTLAEAQHDLTMLVTGAYGQRLLKQNGAPVRLIVPWKYGFKSAKSLVAIDFVAERPPTFWNTAIPHEYGFYANVDPNRDHPRWSQKTEYMIDTYERFDTLAFNGYGRWVSDLYKGSEI